METQRQNKTSRSKQAANRRKHGFTEHRGLVLADRSLKNIILDQGAKMILKDASDASPVPEEVMDLLRKGPAGRSGAKTHVHVGSRDYVCQVHSLKPFGRNSALSGPVVGLHITEIPHANDAVEAIGTKYNLTDREREALHGLTLGLSNRELAKRMNISTNTVRAYLRLIRSRMGVATRGAIVADVLDRAVSGHRPPGEGGRERRAS